MNDNKVKYMHWYLLPELYRTIGWNETNENSLESTYLKKYLQIFNVWQKKNLSSETAKCTWDTYRNQLKTFPTA